MYAMDEHKNAKFQNIASKLQIKQNFLYKLLFNFVSKLSYRAGCRDLSFNKAILTTYNKAILKFSH